MLDIDEANLSPVLWPSFSGTGCVLKSSCIIIKPVSTDRSQLMAKKISALYNNLLFCWLVYFLSLMPLRSFAWNDE